MDFQIDCGGDWKQGGSWKITQMTTGNIFCNEGEKREARKELFESQGENQEGRSTQPREEVCSEVHVLRSLRRQRLSPATPRGHSQLGGEDSALPQMTSSSSSAVVPSSDPALGPQCYRGSCPFHYQIIY